MGMIRARVSDELEQQIQERIEKVKDSVRGAEINMSTVIRYSLEKYLQEEKEEEEGIKTVKFNLKNCNDEELEIIQEMTSKLYELQKLNNKNTTEFYKQLTSVNLATYEIEIDKLRNKKKGE